MKEGKNEFSKEQFWSNVQKAVNNFKSINPGSDTKRYKKDLDKVRVINGVEYLAKVVYIRPPEQVTSKNCVDYYAFAQQELHSVIEASDIDKISIKGFLPFTHPPKRSFTSKPLEVDIEGPKTYPPGTIAVCMGAAIDLVNRFLSEDKPKSKKLKLDLEGPSAQGESELAANDDAALAEPDKDNPEVLSEEEQHLLPFLKQYYDEARGKSPAGEISQNLEWTYNPDQVVHKLAHTVYVTPPQNLSDSDKIRFGNRLREVLLRKINFREKIKATLITKAKADTNYEVTRPNIPGVFRADLANPQYPLGTLMLTRTALVRIANFYRSHFGNFKAPALTGKPGTSTSQPPKKSPSFHRLPDPAPFANELATNNGAQQPFQQTGAIVSEKGAKPHHAQVSAPNPREADAIAILTSSDDDDEAFEREVRRLSSANESLNSALAKKEKQEKDLESKVGEEKKEYQKLRAEHSAQKKAAREAQLEALRAEQRKLSEQNKAADKRIEERTQEYEMLENKISKLKRVKVQVEMERGIFNDPNRAHVLARAAAAPAPQPAPAAATIATPASAEAVTPVSESPQAPEQHERAGKPSEERTTGTTLNLSKN